MKFIFPYLEVISHVTYLLQQGHEELAYRVLGEYVLANVRGALTVGLVLEKHFGPEPSSSKSTTTTKATTEAVWTTEVPEGSATDEEVGSTTEASVKEKRVLRHQNGRVDEM